MVLDVWHTTIEGSLATFYVFVLIIIISSRTNTFKNSFFTIFVATGVADIGSLSFSCFMRLNTELGLGEEFRSVVLCALILSGTTSFAHLVGNMLITLNRYSTICLLSKYESIWTRKNVLAMVIFQYLVSFAASIHILRADLIYIHNENKTVLFAGYGRSVDIICTSTYFGGCLIYAIISASLNARILIEWKRRPKNITSMRHRHNDKGLLIYAMLVFCCTLLMCILQAALAISVFADMKALRLWLSSQYYWTNDVMVSISPFFLLLLSSELRREIVNRFRYKKVQNNSTVFVSYRGSRRSFAAEFK